jgi:hypothetical protein
LNSRTLRVSIQTFLRTRTRQLSAAMGSSPGQDPVFGVFPYCPNDVGATDALLPAKTRWGYHSNQLFYSSLILCSFCCSRRHDYSIGQSLSAWGAWPATGRSPGWLLCISHAQLVRRMAGRARGGGAEPATDPELALTEAACTSHGTSLLNYTLHCQPLATQGKELVRHQTMHKSLVLSINNAGSLG